MSDPIFQDNGISEALARNAATPQKPKFSFGQFLAAWAGNLGDSLTGNPVYGNAMQGRAQAQAQEEERRRQQEWWYEQQRYQQANQPPREPTQTDRYVEEVMNPNTDPRRRALLQQILVPPQAPFMEPYGYERQPEPQQGAAGGDNIPTISSPAQAAGLPPGTRFRTPDGRIKVVPGGQTGAPSGGFPGY